MLDSNIENTPHALHGLTAKKVANSCCISHPDVFLLTVNINLLFLHRCKQENRVPAPPVLKPEISLFMYRHIFNTEFNLGFGLPRSDTCAKCDALHMALQSSGGDDKTRIQRELKEHQEGADLGYQSKKDDKNAAIQSWSGKTRTSGSSNVPNKSKDAVDMITFDFQQNLPTPNLHHNDMFYARQMWTYNFGIHDCVANQGHMFMWDETIAKRGSSEVVSSLLRFFKEFNTGAR